MRLRRTTERHKQGIQFAIFERAQLLVDEVERLIRFYSEKVTKPYVIAQSNRSLNNISSIPKQQLVTLSNICGFELQFSDCLFV
jgi:hypothetical protein